jgi:hypothetical protein
VGLGVLEISLSNFQLPGFLQHFSPTLGTSEVLESWKGWGERERGAACRHVGRQVPAHAHAPNPPTRQPGTENRAPIRAEVLEVPGTWRLVGVGGCGYAPAFRRNASPSHSTRCRDP